MRKILILIIGVIIAIGCIGGFFFLSRGGEMMPKEYAEVMVVFRPNVACTSDSAFNLIQENGGIVRVAIDKEENLVVVHVPKGKEQSFMERINQSEIVGYVEFEDYINYPSIEMIIKDEVEYIVGLWPNVSYTSDLGNLIQENGKEVKEIYEIGRSTTIIVGVSLGEEQNFVKRISRDERVKYVEVNYGKIELL
ncbi:MAG: hypothetical protein QMD22_10210 [archaeon]|nr:hypothetical protein [archaeon]